MTFCFMTLQLLWVILCFLQEKGSTETDELAEKKEREK